MRRRLVKRKRLPKSAGRVRLPAVFRCPTPLGRGVRAPADKEDEYQDDESRPLHLIVTGVPTGISAASRRMSALRMRMQPCEMRPGIRAGSFVP